MSTGQLISIYPETLTFQFELDKQCFCELKVVNSSEHHVAFKVKTTSPKRYFVRPNTGIIQPWDSCIVTVTLQAQKEYPQDMLCKDKFLLISTTVPPITDIDDIPADAFNKDSERVIDERKLRVICTSANESKLGDPKRSLDSNSGQTNSSLDDAAALQHAKHAKDAALRQHRQLQHELETMKRRLSRKRDEGFSFKFLLLVAFVGVVFGFLLNFTVSTPPNE